MSLATNRFVWAPGDVVVIKKPPTAAQVRALYREDQARDESGQWTTDGGGESGRTSGGGSTVAFTYFDPKTAAQVFHGTAKTVQSKVRALAGTLTRHLPGDLEINVHTSAAMAGDNPRVILRAGDPDTDTYLEMSFERHDDGRLTSEMDVLRLDKAQQGEDRGKAILADVFRVYDQQGVDRVELNANIDVGGYAWAKYGFTADLPQDFSRKLSAKLDAVTKHKGTAMSAADKAEVRTVLKAHQDDPKLPWVIAGLHIGDRHIGKELLLGSAWNASMDLKNAEQRERLDRYVRRAATARSLYREDQARDPDGKFAPEGGGGLAGIPPLGRSGDSASSGGSTTTSTATKTKTPGTVERTPDGKISVIVKQDGKTVTFVDLPTGFNPAVAQKLVGMDENQLREQAAQMVQNLPGDVEVKLKAQHLPGQDPVVTIMAHDPDAATEMWRVITRHSASGPVIAKHVYFQLDEKHQDQDVAKHVMADTFTAYGAMGVERVTLSANINVGGYAWAKYGFTAQDPDKLAIESAAKVVGIFHSQDKDTPRPITDREMRATITAIEQHRDDPKLPWVIAGLHIGDRHIGKELLLGASWDGELDLKNPEHTARLQSYLTRPPRGASWRGLYDPNQPRDDQGQWTTEGGAGEGSGGAARAPYAPERRADPEQVARMAKVYTGSMDGASTVGAESHLIITGQPPLTPEEFARHREHELLAAKIWDRPPQSDAALMASIETGRSAAMAQAERTRPLVEAIRQASESATTLFRAVGVLRPYTINGKTHGGDEMRRFDALKPGDPFSLDRVTSFSESADVATQFAATRESIASGIFDPSGDMHPNDADDYENYQFVVEGEHKSLDVSAWSRYGEQERLTQGNFEVVRVEGPTPHYFEVTRETSTGTQTKKVGTTYRRTIVLRQKAVY